MRAKELRWVVDGGACVRAWQDRNPLEPLLVKLASDFSDDQDLSDRLHKLYQVKL